MAKSHPGRLSGWGGASRAFANVPRGRRSANYVLYGRAGWSASREESYAVGPAAFAEGQLLDQSKRIDLRVWSQVHNPGSRDLVRRVTRGT